ncbi:hypothetical protein AUP43_01650 [Oceanibaculum pacificum]|uniref:Uncharacterized protein n=2 Tax=Oceanibaculum pacificum TaxID=580166 RepID=A0A154W4E0_9PROT|nr:hypothetical protein AUP43_01650 [Oceanibaculum pacificum]
MLPSEEVLQCAEKLSEAMHGRAATFAANQALIMLQRDETHLYRFWVQMLRAILVVEEADSIPQHFH